MNIMNIKVENLIIIISNLIGIILLILSYDLIMIYLVIELINLSLYLLIGNYTSGIKYFLLSSIISTLLLLGISLIYSYYGQFSIDVLYSMNYYKYSYIGYMLLLVSIFFKLGVFPFHQWSPDLYSGISYIYMIYIQIFVKFGILILLYNINYLFIYLNNYIIVFGILTIITATLLLNSQYNIQRFIALSSISHLGFLIVQYSYSYLFYVYIYSITSLFLLFLFYSNNNNFVIKFIITFIFFSLSGLPPLPGFYTKLYILIDLLNLGYISVIIVLLLSSIILAANYIYLGLISLQVLSVSKSSPYQYPNLLAIFFTLFTLLPIMW